MSQIASILLPYDFSEASRKGLQYALDFTASRPRTHLQICFISKEADSAVLKGEFEGIASGLGRGYKAKLSWTTLNPPTVDGLLEESKKAKSDLIIMGTTGSGDPEATTKTSQTVLAAHCPVLVVPMGAETEFRLSRIALVLGPREIEDPGLLSTLLDVARSFNARVTVLTIENKPGPYGYSPEEERNEKMLEYYLESFYSHHAYIRNEDVVAGIFEYVEQHEIDLIAILPRNHVRQGTPSEGRLTRILTLQTKTPLLALES